MRGGFPNNTGTVEDRATTNVVTALDQPLTGGSVRSEVISGGLRLRFTPQDAGKNLMGPGQAGALFIAQGMKFATAKFDDFLDGSYRADISGIDVNQAFDLLAPGSRIAIYDPANPNPGGTEEGCTMVRRSATSSTATSIVPALLLLLGLALLMRRVRSEKA